MGIFARFVIPLEEFRSKIDAKMAKGCRNSEWTDILKVLSSLTTVRTYFTHLQ